MKNTLRIARSLVLAVVFAAPGVALAQSPNNNFASATAIAGNTFNGNVNVTGNTKEAGEPNHGGNAGGRSAWFAWTPTTTGVYRLDTAGSAFDTLLAVYEDTPAVPTAANLIVQCNNLTAAVLTSECYVRATAGTTYRVAVDTVAAAQGLVNLNIATEAAPAPNDSIFGGVAVVLGTPLAGNNLRATSETVEPLAHLENGRRASVWYNYVPAVNGVVRVQATATAPSLITPQWAVYTGVTLGTLTRVGGYFPIAVTAGTTYRIQVTGNGNNLDTQQGNFSLSVAPAGAISSIVAGSGLNWEWLHTLDGIDPTTDPNWMSTWKTPGNATVYNGVVSFNPPAPAILAYGGIALLPGTATNIGTPTAVANNNAAYFRRSFTTSAPIANLWAEILADDAAYIYIDNFPGIPVNIREQTAGVPDPDAFSTTLCAAANTTNTEDQTKRIALGSVIGTLPAGTHTIAVSLHQSATSSSDIGFDLQLQQEPIPVGTPIGSGLSIAFEEPALGAQTFAPAGGQSELGWTLTPSAAEDADQFVSVRDEANLVAGFQIPGSTNKFLETRGLRANPFRSAPVDVAGRVDYRVVAKFRSFTSSGTTFEAADNIRAYIETSPNGVAYVDSGLDLQPAIVGGAVPDAILTELGPGIANTPMLTWVTKTLTVTGNTAVAARLVILGGSDSATENILIDDIRFEPNTCLLTPALSNLVRNNQGNDILADDTFSFDVTVTAQQNGASTGWTSNATPASGSYGATVPFGPFLVSGGFRTIIFSDNLDANCNTPLTVPPPACLIGAPLLGGLFRNEQGTPTLADDTVDFNLTVTAANASTGWTSTVPGLSGPYGGLAFGLVSGTVSPLTVTVTDNADPACFTTFVVTAPPASRYVMGTQAFDFNAPYILSDFTPPAQWINNTNGVLSMDNGGGTVPFTLRSTVIDLSAETNPVTFTATLTAFEDSAGSNFENTDSLDVIATIDAGLPSQQTINLITPFDRNGNGVINGYSGADAADYAANKIQDEFNLNQVDEPGNAMGTFNLSLVIPASASTFEVAISGVNDSAAEHYTVTNMTLTAGGGSFVDTDLDGMDDNWEIFYFGSITAENGGGNRDGDEQTNLAEFEAGTDPTKASSSLRVTAFSRTGGTSASVTFTSVPGKRYQMEISPSLVNATWTNSGIPVSAGAGATTTTTITFPAGPPRAYFVRSRVIVP